MDELKDKVYKYDYPPQVRKEIEGLERIASAIIYDGKVDLYEVQILREWIMRNEQHLVEKPLSELKKLFQEINADTVVSHTERETLFHFLDAIASQPTHRGSNPEFFDDIDNLEVKGKTFAFEGKLVFGSKYKAEQVVVSNGGNYAEALNENVDYLIVGVLESKAYTDKEYPPLLAEALKLKETNNSQIFIVRERVFVQSLIG